MQNKLPVINKAHRARLLPPEYCRANAYTFKLDDPSDFADIDPLNTEAMIAHSNQLLRHHNAILGIGRYAEARDLYQHPQYGGEAIMIHLGLDLSAPVGTPLFAPLDGRIHSFQDNTEAGNYGPTVILQHKIDQSIFYSLYGHLSRNDLQEFTIGDKITTGEKFGHIGAPSENGGWPPHVHVQLILDIGNHKGDFPGVCAPNIQNDYLACCPDPEYIINID